MQDEEFFEFLAKYKCTAEEIEGLGELGADSILVLGETDPADLVPPLKLIKAKALVKAAKESAAQPKATAPAGARAPAPAPAAKASSGGGGGSAGGGASGKWGTTAIDWVAREKKALRYGPECKLVEKFPLVEAKAFKEHKANLPGYLARVGACMELGAEVTLELNDLEYRNAMVTQENGGQYANQELCAEHLYGDFCSVLKCFADNTERLAQDDDLKAALRDAWTTGVVRVLVDPAAKLGPVFNTSIEEGSLVFRIHPVSSRIMCQMLNRLARFV